MQLLGVSRGWGGGGLQARGVMALVCHGAGLWNRDPQGAGPWSGAQPDAGSPVVGLRTPRGADTWGHTGMTHKLSAVQRHPSPSPLSSHPSFALPLQLPAATPAPKPPAPGSPGAPPAP